MTITRRAIALREPYSESEELDRLVKQHDLDIVHTIYIDPASPHAPMIAAEQILYHNTGVVVVPELRVESARAAKVWRIVVGLAHLVTSTGVIECSPDEISVR